jgi:hypothetical protein
MGLLRHIDDSLVGYTPGEPAFLQLVSDTLGDEASPEDGFDADFNSVMATVGATEAMINEADSAFADLGSAVDILNTLDPSDLVLDFGQGVPVINSFLYNLQLKSVGALSLPPLPKQPSGGPPLPPPQPPACIPAPSPQPQPQPVPCVPAPQPCPEGFVSTDQGCVPAPKPPVPLPPAPQPCAQGFVRNDAGDCVPEPCAEGFIRTPEGCQPEPPAPPPPPTGIPLPPLQPCAQGFVRNDAGDCVPEQPCPEGFISTDQGCEQVKTPSAPPPPPPVIAPTAQPCPPGFISNVSGDCVQPVPPEPPPTLECPPGWVLDASGTGCDMCDPTNALFGGGGDYGDPCLGQDCFIGPCGATDLNLSYPGAPEPTDTTGTASPPAIGSPL